MKKLVFIVLASIFIFASRQAFAVEGRGGGDDDNNESRIRIEQRIERDDNRVRIRIEKRREQKNELEIENEQEVEIKGNNFEITGEISKVDTGSFVVALQTIFVDPNLVQDFEQRGLLKVGERVKVEGIIIDGKKFAREIKVLANNEEVRIEIKNATQAARAKVEVKARGPFDQINDLLRQILNFFTGQRS